jgi:hypothetical protein
LDFDAIFGIFEGLCILSTEKNNFPHEIYQAYYFLHSLTQFFENLAFYTNFTTFYRNHSLPNHQTPIVHFSSFFRTGNSILQQKSVNISVEFEKESRSDEQPNR